MKPKVFKILISSEFYASREPVEYEFFEINQMRKVLVSLAKYRDWRQANLEVAVKIQEKRLAKMYQKYLKIWRTGMYLVDQEKNLAEPHFLGVV